MGNVRTRVLGFGSLILALGCDDAFVLGDEVLTDSSRGGSMNGGSIGLAGNGEESGGGSGGGATGGDGATRGDGATGGTGTTEGGGTGATGGTGTTGGGGTGATGGTGTTGGGGVTSSPPVTAGDGATGGTLELADCGLTSLPMIDGPDAIAAPELPSTGVTGDFNHDGALDLATADYSGTVSVFFGRGDGSFSSSDSYTTGLGELTSGWGSIALADLDGNDELDLVTTRATAAVSVLLGARDGSFDDAVTYDVGFDATGVAIGDWTGDQIADLVVVGTTNDGGVVSVLEGQDDGTFASEEPLWNGMSARAIAAADLDGNDKLDLVVSGVQSVTVLQGDGLGGYENEASYPTEPGGILVTLADFSRDQVLDIVVESDCEGYVQSGRMVFLGTGDGGFEAGVFHQTASCPYRTMAGDVNGDDVPDIVSDLHRVTLSDGNGGFLPEPEVTGPSTLVGGLVGLGDFDADSKLDAVTASTGWLAVRTGRGDGSFRSPPVIELEPITSPTALVVADLDGDDQPDIVTTAYDTLSVLLGAGDRTFAAPVNYTAGSLPQGLETVDLDRDGNLDLVTFDFDQGVTVMLATGPGEYDLDVHYLVGTTALQVGDVDFDGIVDLVAVKEGSLITVLIGEGDGTFVPLPDQLATGYPMAATLFDTNQDDRLDLVLADAAPLLSVWFGQGDGTFAPGPETTMDISADVLESGHVDGDNMPDLVAISYQKSFRVFLSNGDGSFGATQDLNTVAYSARVIDFDQDGKNDVVSNFLGLGVLFGNGDGTFACKQRFDIWGDAVVFDVADVDGDGRVDVVTRTETDISVFPNLPR